MRDDPTPVGPGDSAGEEARLRGLLSSAARQVPSGDPLSVVYAVRRKVRWRRFRRAAGAGGTALAVAGAAVLVSAAGRDALGPAGSAPPYRLTGALVSFDGCTDYLAYLRRQAAAVVGPYGLQNTRPYFAVKGVFGPHAGPAFNGFEGRGITTGSAGSAGLATDPLTHSGTNNQVAGVDEPDSIKTDGRIVVTLTGATLRVLDTTARVLGVLQLSGDTGGGVMLAGDRAVVLSSPTLPPSFEPRFRGFGYLAPAAAAPTQGSQAAVIDLADPTHPSVLRTFTFDGSIVAARLVHNSIRMVLRSDGPRITFQSPTSPGEANTAKAANRRVVANSTLADWLPAWQVQNPDGATTARQPLAGCEAVARPQHPSGLSTVSVVTLDPLSSAPGPATSVVAAGDTVYASADHLYVAGLTQETASPRPANIRTRLYDFAITGADRPRFLGAGSVPGSLLNSYAMDQDANGFLRVASTSIDTRGMSESRITVIDRAGEALVQQGVVGNLGRGQQLRAVRFLGDVAYVVTFRTFDPLYVVDLRNPRKPIVAGQLEQPGYSEFLYPLPNHRLLGVGVEITNNEPSGLLLSTYDVADPAHPRRLDASLLASGFAATYGGYDPHAFLYWPAAALAVVAVSNGNGNTTGAAGYRISPSGQLTRLTTLAHGALTPTRTAVIGNDLWAFTTGGVIVSSLASLHIHSWRPY